MDIYLYLYLYKRAQERTRDSYCIKVCNDLIEEPQTLYTHIVSIQLNVEVIEVWDGGEQDAHLRVGLIVQVL